MRTNRRRAIPKNMPVARQQHTSAADAFAQLRAGRRIRKRHVNRKVQAAARAYGLTMDGRMGVEQMINLVFKNNGSKLGKVFNKSIRVVEEDGTGDVCVFSDVYHVTMTDLDEIAQRCTDAGLPVTAFVHDYPGLQFSEGFVPNRNVAILNGGYAQFYRGCMAGLRFAG